MQFSTKLGISLLFIVNTLYVLSGLKHGHGVIHNNSLLPTTFSECVDAIIHPSLPKYLLQTVQNLCLDWFISVDHTHKWTQNFTVDEHNYIKSIFRKVISDASRHSSLHSRGKRSANMITRRVRREVRDTPHSHWQQFARNVRRLKYEVITPTGRSKYDIIADIHGTAVNSAHFGPNFLPWHRIYLIVFEAALGVSIPYWDSSICNDMEDPTQSIVWTEKYFGNGFGVVRTGPFANFQTPVGPLFRNIGSDGSLFDRREIDVIFTKSRFGQISEPTADEGASLEGQHNDIHVWIDGVMNDLSLSPHDPCFYLHHCFVDYLWETFRSLQYKLGIDPSTDTIDPPENVTFQNFTQASVGLVGYYNSDGYSNMLASMVKYGDSPKCLYCSQSPDLYCDKRQNVCIGRTRNLKNYQGNPNEAIVGSKIAQMMTEGHLKPFPLYSRDRRVRMDSVTMNYTAMNQTNSENGDASVNNIVINANNGQKLNMEIKIKIDTSKERRNINTNQHMANNGIQINSQSLSNDMGKTGQPFAYGMARTMRPLSNYMPHKGKPFANGMLSISQRPHFDMSQNRHLPKHDMLSVGQPQTDISQNPESFTNYKSFINHVNNMSLRDHLQGLSWNSQPDMSRRNHHQGLSWHSQPDMSRRNHPQGLSWHNQPDMSRRNHPQGLSWESQPVYKNEKSVIPSGSELSGYKPREVSVVEHKNLPQSNFYRTNLHSDNNNIHVLQRKNDIRHVHDVLIELKPGPVEYRDRGVAVDILSYKNKGSSNDQAHRTNVLNNYVEAHGGHVTYKIPLQATLNRQTGHYVTY